MRVFISWSGDKGRELADTLHKWIPAVLQAAKPYFSPDNISKGARWSTEIGKTLEECRVGLICVTRDSVNAPWVVFEAGALSKSIESSRVIPILFDLDTSEVTGPLVQFQSAKFSRAEVRRVIETINGELGDQKLEANVLDEVFEMWWPKLDASVTKILKQEEKEPSAARSDRDMIEEILTVTRTLAKSQLRPEARRSEGIHPTVIGDLATGLTGVYLAAAADPLRETFVDHLNTLVQPVEWILRSRHNSLPESESAARRSALEDAKAAFKHALEEDLPF